MATTCPFQADPPSLLWQPSIPTHRLPNTARAGIVTAGQRVLADDRHHLAHRFGDQAHAQHAALRGHGLDHHPRAP